MICPCGTGRAFDDCCGPILAGQPAPTAEALMRSRYVAYTKVDIDHITRTHDPKTLQKVDRAHAEAWAKQSQWTGLTVLSSEKGGVTDDAGVVLFEARYRSRGRDLVHAERSRFRRIDGRWHYVDGGPLSSAPVVAAARTGRNEPCPCGSGKKWKRCHGA